MQVMIEIAENANLSDEDKRNLIMYTRERFKNRRRMAYIALIAIVASLGLLFLGAFIDGLSDPCPAGQTCKGVLAAIKENQTIFTWINGFLTAIVGAYYGISAWKPSS